MTTTLTHLIVGFLFLGTMASLALVWAFKNTAHGCEDETGFHHEAGGEKAKAANDMASRINPRNFLAS